MANGRTTAATGETLWVFNPKAYESGTPTKSIYWNHRGAAYWTDGTQERIFWGTGDAYLWCVDAKTALWMQPPQVVYVRACSIAG